MKGFIRIALSAVGIYLTLFLLLFFSSEISEGIKSGIDTCISLVIPSTFLFLIISDLLSRTNGGRILARPFCFLHRWFCIPKEQVDAVMLSLIGGYPVGARILSQRVRSGQLDRKTAQRMLSYCVHASPAFLYTGIGIGIFHSSAIGCTLLISTLLAFVVTGLFSRIGAKRPASASVATRLPKENASVLFVSSIKGGVQAMALICGSVVLFSAFLPLLRLVLTAFLPQELADCICGLLEVCSGSALIRTAGFTDPVAAAALFSAFGGICVFLQIASMLHGSGISMKRMLIGRVIYTAVATGCAAFLSRFLPQSALESFSVFEGTLNHGSSSSPLAVGFLLLLVILLLFFSAHPVTIRIKRKHSG